MANKLSQIDGYDDFLREIKERVRGAQIRASLSVNRELVLLYWQIGREILTRQQQQGWGAKVIEHLARDLKEAFPEMKGFSARNLKYMRAFAEVYLDEQFVQQAAAQIPWFHNCVILDKVKNNVEREWYIKKTIENGWSRNILTMQIENRLFERQGKAVTNFNTTLPTSQSDLARETLKDPYIFDFLSLGEEVQEREVEKQLVEHITKFLLELGVGFAFVGKQYPLKVGAENFYIDLLFYHVKLHCYVVIELKAGKFQPEYTGKINFYLSAVDDLLKSSVDNPSIGLILCASKDNVIAEYALRDVNKPIGIAEWQTQLTKSLPKELQTNLPTIEQLEAELDSVSIEIED
ncbi:LOW QUALITY PROTEIN: putative nuclease of restriction endonuclease-like (RecB) superfamily [Dulcicalothrix desertica PCC 7102]|nr:LOW QUALITY PROTEIN: putative nuclease of restriction endonuclease-like (RecB) superfamily [Dulcicalothrix desertica PCC 7102]